MAWAVALSVSLAMWDPGLVHQSPALEAPATDTLRQTADNLSSLGSSRVYMCLCALLLERALQQPEGSDIGRLLPVLSCSPSMTAEMSQVPTASTAGPGAGSCTRCPATQVLGTRRATLCRLR